MSLFGFEKNQTMKRVNEIIQEVEQSALPQNEAFNNILASIHPALQPLVNELRKAFIKGVRNCETASRRSTNASDWTHHGCNRLTRLIKDLQETVKMLAQETEVQALDTEIDAIGKKIAESILRRRQENPIQDLKVAVQSATLPVLLKIEAVIQGQLNAQQLFCNFISLVEASLIMGILRSTSREANRVQRTESTQTSTSTNPSITTTAEVANQETLTQTTLIEHMTAALKNMLPNLLTEELKKVYPNENGTVQRPEQPHQQRPNLSTHQQNNSGNGAHRKPATGRSYASVARSGRQQQQSCNNVQQQQQRQQQQHQPYHQTQHQRYQQQQHQQRRTNQQSTTLQQQPYQNTSSAYWTKEPTLRSDQEGWTTVSSHRRPWRRSERQQSRTFSAEPQQNYPSARHHQNRTGGLQRGYTNLSNN